MRSKTLTHLPAEHLHSITSFMTGVDAVSFSNTCHQINRDLNIGMLDNFYPIERLDRSDCDDQFHLWMELPLPLQERLHSIHLNASWKDQGWGNRKGNVSITSSIHAFTPDIVVNSGAEHTASQLNLEFKVQPGKKYYLMYRVGGGGGHSLHVSDIKLKFLIHGAGGVAKMHKSGFRGDELQRALLEAIALSFETALENGKNPDPHLKLALRRFGLPGLDREAIDSLRDMARLMEEKNETVEVFQDSTGNVESDARQSFVHVDY